MGSYRKRRQAPLRTCRGCGRRFRAWREDRYCGRDDCRQLRLGGDEPPPQEKKPGTLSYGEFPEGF